MFVLARFAVQSVDGFSQGFSSFSLIAQLFVGDG